MKMISKMWSNNNFDAMSNIALYSVAHTSTGLAGLQVSRGSRPTENNAVTP